jgi:hypothetical protein
LGHVFWEGRFMAQSLYQLTLLISSCERVPIFESQSHATRNSEGGQTQDATLVVWLCELIPSLELGLGLHLRWAR